MKKTKGVYIYSVNRGRKKNISKTEAVIELSNSIFVDCVDGILKTAEVLTSSIGQGAGGVTDGRKSGNGIKEVRIGRLFR